MLQTAPSPPHVSEELDLIAKRLLSVRENLTSLADDFGVHLDHPEMTTPDREGSQPGLDQLRTTISEINGQIAYIEQEYDRLFAARAQLFGIGDGKWHETNAPVGHGPIQPGNFRSHP